MTVTARKFNPGFLSDDELVATFCVRTQEFASMVETLRECSGNSNTHQIVIGPRGSGKTSLLLRIASEMRRDAELASRFFPVVFAEESYQVSTAGEFWLECLSRLADQAPHSEDGPDLRRSFEELRGIRDDRMLGDRCLGVLQDFADREGRRLALVVENLNMMFRDMADDDAGWRLRHTLQTEPRVVLLASATSRFEEIDNPDRALYDLFRVLPLRPLDVDDCAMLWQTVSGQHRAPQTIRALRILTGGSPRLLTIVARFGAKLSFRELMADLLNLVDDHTEYFKSHLDALPAQERRVFLALADLWKPATAKEVAEWTRLDTSKCSAHLARLTDRGAVEVAGGTSRRRLYYLAERLYNIYFLMRRARGPAPLIKALIRFMEGYYSADELKEFGARIAQEALEIDGKALSHYRTAFEHLVELPSLAAHRDELLSLTPATFAFADQDEDRPAKATPSTPARELLKKGYALAQNGRTDEALAVWNEVVKRFGTSRTPEDIYQVSHALVNIGVALYLLGRHEEALGAWDDVVRRCGDNTSPALSHAVARALNSKGTMLMAANRPREALAAWDELLLRFMETHTGSLRGSLAEALVGKSAALTALNRPKEALGACDELLGRFGASETPELLDQIAGAMVSRGGALVGLGRLHEAVETWSQVVERFGASNTPKFVNHVALALGNMATFLLQLNRPKEALGACDELLGRFGASETPELLSKVAGAMVSRGAALVGLDRLHEAVETWSQVVERFGASNTPKFVNHVALALGNMATFLLQLNRPKEALGACDELLGRFGASETPELLDQIAGAMVNRGVALVGLGRLHEAVETWSQVVERFGASNTLEIVNYVAIALGNMATALFQLNRPKEALAVCKEIMLRYAKNDEPQLREVTATALLIKGNALGLLGRIEEAIVAWRECARRIEPFLEEQEPVATALMNMGTALCRASRAEEALAAWGQLALRFGTSDQPKALALACDALNRRGALLEQLDRHEEALAVWEEVERRFGTRDEPGILVLVARSFVNRGVALDQLGRPEEALAVFDQAVQRFGTSDASDIVHAVAAALLNKGVLLAGMRQAEEAVATWSEVVQRFGTSDEPSLRHTVDGALLGLAEHELKQDMAKMAVETATRVLQHDEGLPDSKWRGYFIRARAHLAEDNETECVRDIEAGLRILPGLDFLPKKALDALSLIAVEFGPAKMRDLIRESPAADLLLPLTTALERELGLEPRVAKEVEEVAEDIRRDMEERRKK